MTNTRQRQQLQVLRLLRDCDFVSHQLINEAIWNCNAAARPKSRTKGIKIIIASLRLTLHRVNLGLEIHSILQRGYYLSPEDRQQVDTAILAIRGEYARYTTGSISNISTEKQAARTLNPTGNRTERADLQYDHAD